MAARVVDISEDRGGGALRSPDAPTLPRRGLDRRTIPGPPTADHPGPGPASSPARGVDELHSSRRADGAAASADELFVALMGVPSRYRNALAGYGSVDGIDAALRYRRDPTAWSALELITHVADSLHAAARCAVALRDGDRDRCVSPLHVDAPRAGANAAPALAALGALQAAATDLARAVCGLELDGSRPASRLGDTSREVRDLLELALHEAHHHLADVEVLLEASVSGFG